MSQSFILVGGNDKKLILENATHPCPRCKREDTVQLTRREKNLILFNKRIELPNSMRVRYECRTCNWKNETLPDDDPLFQAISCRNEEETQYRQECYSSIISSSMSANSSMYPGSIADATQQSIFKKRASYTY